ncbi:hypothetical protein BJ875DRAFT_510235 [Amylocarpus encephaloides]|uniref:AAA+ ATPase domain-containing protein n=1 Tax=Amylocarpus encephaloides TaxID=45428 RepID=A0A9P7YIJ9_9HELO|nr:hypothetical protein BJ875DRAFT_510235 [Amylocarpus encephaloides]
MPSKRRLDTFDFNKSDSADENFDPTESRPRKAPKSLRKRGKMPAKKRGRNYGGSDISDELEDDDDLSIEEPSDEEEDIEVNEKTGRAMRKAAKKGVSYEEPSDSDGNDFDISASEEEVKVPAKKLNSRNKRKRMISDDESDHNSSEKAESASPPKKIVKLKMRPGTLNLTTTSRAGSQIRNTRRRGSTMEPLSAGITTRRHTRATSEAMGDEPIALSDSGRHIIREGYSPEPLKRQTRGGKGVKKPAFTIKEETQESTQENRDEEAVMEDEIAGTDEQEDPGVVDAPDVEVDEQEDAEERAAQPDLADEEDDDDDVVPISRGRRGSRPSALVVSDLPVEGEEAADVQSADGGSRRLTRRSKNKQDRRPADAGSDFEPGEESPDELSASDHSSKKNKNKDDEYSSGSQRRGRIRVQPKSKSTSRRRAKSGSDEDELDPDELAEELQDLKGSSRRRRQQSPQIVYDRSTTRTRPKINYAMKPLHEVYAEDEGDDAPTPTRRTKSGSLNTTFGPFGGGGGPSAVLGGPWGAGATGGVDSDSSDDDNMARPSNLGGNIGMTPTTGVPTGLLAPMGQTNPMDPANALSGNAPNVGKIKSQKALADADPLGVDQNVDFSKVGGLDGHIDKLKEMVQMPLLYPELFLKFHVVPPRGVLFHGPPGTGKTLLARALAAQIGSNGQKITFYMRKGADALSKWVGEAERQLRLLFEEARKTQPSIIFFDEIDGLAPVRSSKQEQIHASIVSTLLALMDGMDGRGQVIVIGATNRPDNIDPALRRPGRFDREFYFPLPDLESRKSIININTQDWGIDDGFKTSLAHVTKGYGGADLRALCTEAALNSIQRTYPQIYSSNAKLLVDADKIKVTAKDFMLSVKSMIPSSERATSSGAAPLPKLVEPLLRDQLKKIETVLGGLIPIKKKTTALEEAMYEQYDDEDQGFGRETMQQEFEKSRVFRPRLLIHGEPGMGQVYLGGAILNHFEGLHVQNFDLPTLFNDAAKTPEAAIVQLFAEVKRHKPSVIYIPAIEVWYQTLSKAQIDTFLGLLKAIPPTDPVLVLGITEGPIAQLDPEMLRELFGFSRKNRLQVERPEKHNREAFFAPIREYVEKKPNEFPEPLNRKKRQLDILEVAPPPEVKPPSKEEIKAQKQRDHYLLNLLKVQIQPIMDQIQKKYRKFRAPAIPQASIQYLIDEQAPGYVRPDLPQFRPYEIEKDKDGNPGLLETASGKFFRNLETTTIEERLSNGFYARPKDFLADIRSLTKDAKHINDKERILRANEMLSNVEVDMMVIEGLPQFADCEDVYQRQLQRAKEREAKLEAARKATENLFAPIRTDIPEADPISGPVILGEPIPSGRPTFSIPLDGSSSLSNGISSGINGSSVPSHVEDVRMEGTDEPSQRISQPTTTMGPPSQLRSVLSAHQSNPAPTSQLSQRSAFQELPQGVSPSDLINDASTTTSGKKTSEGWSTQATNGISHGAQSSSPLEKPGPESQIPDTQQFASQNPSQQAASDPSSEDNWPHSQAHGLKRGNLQGFQSQNTPSTGSQFSQSQTSAPPPFKIPARSGSTSKPTGFANILNDPPFEEIASSSQFSSQNEFMHDSYFGETLLNRLVSGSSGFGVEQLEQINRELMNVIWDMRGEWNRNIVAGRLVEVFNETIADIEAMQKVLAASQPSQQGH